MFNCLGSTILLFRSQLSVPRVGYTRAECQTLSINSSWWQQFNRGTYSLNFHYFLWETVILNEAVSQTRLCSTSWFQRTAIPNSIKCIWSWMQTLPINLSRPQLVNNVCVRNVKRFRARHNSEWHPRGQTSQDDVHTNTISREDTDDTKPFARFRCFACIPTVASAFLRDIRNCPISYNKVNERIRARHNVVSLPWDEWAKRCRCLL